LHSSSEASLSQEGKEYFKLKEAELASTLGISIKSLIQKSEDANAEFTFDE